MKKGQMSMEISILIIGALVCACIGGFYFSSNVADSGNNVGESASNTNSAFESTSINSINSLSEDFDAEGELLLNGGSGQSEPTYWIKNTSQAWIKTNLNEGINTITITKGGTTVGNGNDVFIYFDDFSEDLSGWTTGGQVGSFSIVDGYAKITGSSYRSAYYMDMINYVTVPTEGLFIEYDRYITGTSKCGTEKGADYWFLGNDSINTYTRWGYGSGFTKHYLAVTNGSSISGSQYTSSTGWYTAVLNITPTVIYDTLKTETLQVNNVLPENHSGLLRIRAYDDYNAGAGFYIDNVIMGKCSSGLIITQESATMDEIMYTIESNTVQTNVQLPFDISVLGLIDSSENLSITIN